MVISRWFSSEDNSITSSKLNLVSNHVAEKGTSPDGSPLERRKICVLERLRSRFGPPRMLSGSQESLCTANSCREYFLGPRDGFWAPECRGR